jgi:hypothetical protein
MHIRILVGKGILRTELLGCKRRWKSNIKINYKNVVNGEKGFQLGGLCYYKENGVTDNQEGGGPCCLYIAKSKGILEEAIIVFRS